MQSGTGKHSHVWMCGKMKKKKKKKKLEKSGKFDSQKKWEPWFCSINILKIDIQLL